MNILNGLTIDATLEEAVQMGVLDYIKRHRANDVMAGFEDNGSIDEAFGNCCTEAESFEGLIDDMRIYVIDNFVENEDSMYHHFGVSQNDFY